LVSDEQAVGKPDGNAPEDETQPEEIVDVAEAGAQEEEQAVLDPAAQLEAAQAQAAEYLDGWQRARAELANYRKRTERERAEMESLLRADTIQRLLPVLDDFDRAMDTLPEDIAGHEWVEGIALIYRKLQGQLVEMGVSEIQALGQPFDPTRHEAVMQRETPDVESGCVAEVLRKGYMIKDWILRPAMVVVAE
jgi:molecular chaperone GrpE